MTSTFTIERVSAGRAAAIRSVVTRKLRRGQALLEILVGVAIIAVVAAILIPNLTHAKQNADVSASEANLKQIATAIELFNNDNQNYPASGNVTPALFTGGPAGNPASYYLQSVPNSPGQGGGQYVYTTDGVGNYTIDDPATYQKGTLTNVEAATENGGDATDGSAKCTNACQHLGYSNTVGLDGH
jgi:type II secretory pathway pseudopilin PulG